jgi:glyoxylase I family protein
MTIGLKTDGIHHLALRSTDLARARAFYGATLGFPIVLDTAALFIFLAGDTAIAVRAPERPNAAADRFDPFRVGLDHVALGCRDERELARVAVALEQAGIASTGVKLDPLLQRRYVAFKDPDGIAWEFYMAPNVAIEVIEAYLDGLRTHDLSRVPFDPDVNFESPLAPRVAGRDAVVGALNGILPAVSGVRVQSHIAEGEYVATRFDLETPAGWIEVFDRFRVRDGRLLEIRPFYDPRPLVAPVASR